MHTFFGAVRSRFVKNVKAMSRKIAPFFDPLDQNPGRISAQGARGQVSFLLGSLFMSAMNGFVKAGSTETQSSGSF